MLMASMSQSQNPTDTQALVQSMLQKLKLQQGKESQPVLNTAASSEEQVKTSPVSHHTKNGSHLNSSLSAVDKGVGDGGEERVGELDKQPGITSPGELLPSKFHKDADITSSDRSDGERTISSSVALPNNYRDQQITPGEYMLSKTSSDSHTEEQQNKGVHLGNGGFNNVASKSSNSNFRNENSAERKARRWTSKIKERWRYRRSSVGKKEKDDGGTAVQKNAKITDIPLVNPFNTLPKDGDENLNPRETPPSQAEDPTVDIPTRPTSDFDFGLGSFSLLDEITRGQEWAKFINPNLTTTAMPSDISQSHNQTSLIHQNTNQSSGLIEDGRSTWNFKSAESSKAKGHQLPDASSHVSMDDSGQREADQSEPMEDGLSQSTLHPAENGLDQQSRSFTFAKPVDSVYGSMQRSRFQQNRKRQHQSQTQQISDGSEAEGSVTSRHAMDESESQHFIFTSNSHPTPESASSSIPPAAAPRGVLKHSMSWDQEAAMEIQSKRRRLEENRHVQFSEEVVFIESPVLDFTDSEEEELEEEEDEDDLLTEQEAEVEQAPMEEVAPVRRHGVPQWILSLKNLGKKHG